MTPGSLPQVPLGYPQFVQSLQSQMLPFQDHIRIFMMGDVVGQPGRKAVRTFLPHFKKAFDLDFVTINGENLAGGFGITQNTFEEMLQCGVDAVTMGNHWSDKPEVHKLVEEQQRLVLPRNIDSRLQNAAPPEFELPRWHKTLSIWNLMGQFAMKQQYENPFAYLQKYSPLVESKVRSGQHIAIADVHAEASSEKQAMLWLMNGIFAGFIGTHTHTPTCDERITHEGTAFLTDIGMTGPYHSVIGMTIERSLQRYLNPTQKRPQEVAKSDVWLCGFLIEISPQSGLALQAHRIQWRSEQHIWSHSTIQRGPNPL